ncbi:MAG: helix-turn-helix domain-containing protein [Candidatus Hermodarchaeota archaeon]|nr:helix-turn-helix domain-containing protein [Candidatus Hermodarchaeota archaeon]
MTEFRVPTPKELQELRKKAGLTQSELASKVGISQSLVARIEKGQVNPSLSTLKRILSIIERQQQSHSTIKDLLKWKTSTSKIQPVIAIQIHEKVRRAVNLMRRHGISQLPVFRKDTPVGSISESTILRKLMLMESGKVFALSVQEIMEAPFPTIDVGESVEAAFMKIASGVEAILAMDGERPAGLLTKIDLIAYTRV